MRVLLGRNVLHVADAIDALRSMDDGSVDSIVTDPPYGLSDHSGEAVRKCLSAWLAGEPFHHGGRGFMGKSWDAWVPGPELWRECLRVLKPGGHALVFAGTRSMDLMSMALRLSGFELRDNIGYAHDGGGAPLAAWVYGSGFPKSLDVSKAIDKAAGVEREVVGSRTLQGRAAQSPKEKGGTYTAAAPSSAGLTKEVHITTPATDAAKQWSGWGTALKPAWEPIIIARKPLDGTVAENVLRHGTGAINVDGCRLGTDETLGRAKGGWGNKAVGANNYGNFNSIGITKEGGRWPANVIHDGSDEAVGLFPTSKDVGYGGHGSSARFFYSAKASKQDREFGLGGLRKATPHESLERKEGSAGLDSPQAGAGRTASRANTHPTVKPVALMRYLVRLVTPPDGVVLDPFVGSGTTLVAAELEGFRCVACERDSQWEPVIRGRFESCQQRFGDHEVDDEDD